MCRNMLKNTQQRIIISMLGLGFKNTLRDYDKYVMIRIKTHRKDYV